jgi:hypothetical protein
MKSNFSMTSASTTISVALARSGVSRVSFNLEIYWTGGLLAEIIWRKYNGGDGSLLSRKCKEQWKDRDKVQYTTIFPRTDMYNGKSASKKSGQAAIVVDNSAWNSKWDVATVVLGTRK